MKHRNLTDFLARIMLAGALALLLQACGSDVGGNEDDSQPVARLTSLNDGEEVIGTWPITWDTSETNRSTVDLYISNDSGATWALMKSTLPDTGNYSWDSNEVDDCRRCRMRVVPKDVVGNVGAPADSTQDFVVNNVPQVLGIAFYRDVGNDESGTGDGPVPGDGPGPGDEIRVPFDKDLELRTSIASDIFSFPVLGDSVGSFAEISRSPSNPRELLITMNDLSTFDFHLHVRGLFDPKKLGRTAPSGINLLSNISEGVIFAPDTGRTADAAASGIDIVPTFNDINDPGQPALVPLNSQVNGTAFGDVDGDGDLDLVQGYLDEPNRVLLNGGDNTGSNTGVFSDPLNQMLGNNSTNAIALGDVDGDEDLDLVTGNTGANIVWLNGGDSLGTNTGVFDVGPVPAFVGDNDKNTRAIALGDVDGDGDLDLVTGNTDNEPNRVWLNGGDSNGTNTGVFSDPRDQMLGNSLTFAIALGDVDGDGDLDLVAGNSGPNQVWLNGGDSTGTNTGVFSDPPDQMLGNSLTIAIVLSDVDGDGDLDVDGDGICDVDLDEDGDCNLDLDLVAGNSGPNQVWLNDGESSGTNTGLFSDSGQTLGDRRTNAIAMGDVDDDGDLDLTVGNFIEPDRVFLNDGSGSFIDSGQVLVLGNFTTHAIALGDVDGDGDLDLAANSLFLNSLASTELFIESDQLEFFGRTLKSGALGDVDGDGDLDLVAAFSGSDRVLLNNGSGSFTDSGQMLGTLNTNSVALGDVDGDGDLDVDGDGICDVDLDHDGDCNLDLDLVTAGGGIRVWPNPGDSSGEFGNAGPPEGNDSPFSIALGDVNGDGKLDLIVGNFVQPNRVLLNDGGGNFTDSDQELGEIGNNSTFAVALGDVDGDGDLDVNGDGICDVDLDDDDDCNLGLDLVVGNISNEPNQMLLNDSDGVFSPTMEALGSNSGDIALGDVDGDGDLDLVVSGRSSPGSDRVFINNGSGIFTGSGQDLGSSSFNIVELEDIDGDGDLDLLTGIFGPNRVWLNGGESNGSNTGVFLDFGQKLGDYETKDIVFGDIDGDGDLDYIEFSKEFASTRLIIWLNDF